MPALEPSGMKFVISILFVFVCLSFSKIIKLEPSGRQFLSPSCFYKILKLHSSFRMVTISARKVGDDMAGKTLFGKIANI